MRRQLAAALAAILLATGGLVGLTASPAVADPPPTCVFVPGNYIQWFDSFHCQGPPGAGLVPIQPVALGHCYQLTDFTDAGHPPPNGWGNAISSIKMAGTYRARFWDGVACTGTALLIMTAPEIRYTLPGDINNKISAFRITIY